MIIMMIHDTVDGSEIQLTSWNIILFTWVLYIPGGDRQISSINNSMTLSFFDSDFFSTYRVHAQDRI